MTVEISGSYTTFVFCSQAASTDVNFFGFAVFMDGGPLDVSVPPVLGVAHRETYSVTRLS